MNDIETRLRDAFRADAETVKPETIHPFTAPGRRRAAQRGRILVPLAAAATVAAILAGIGVAAPKIWPGSPSPGPMTASAVAAGFARGKIPAGPPPKFLLALVPNRPGDTLRLETISTTTGHVIARLGAPAPHRHYVAAAPAGSDRTFILAATGTRCRTWFYALSFSAAGRPESITALDAQGVAGRAYQAQIAVSLNGRLLAYATSKCTSKGIRQHYGQIGLINLKTRSADRTWRFRWPAQPTDLSLSYDGSVLEMVSNPSDGSRGASPAFDRVWVLRMSAPSGRLEQRYRRVFGPRPLPIAAVLSPNARLIWAVTGAFHRHPSGWRLNLSEYATATGALVGTKHLPSVSELGPDTLAADVSGRYLLFANGGSPMRWIDLATGRVVTIPGRAANLPLDVAW